MKRLCWFVLASRLAVSLFAGEAGLPGDRMLADYFRAETLKVSEASVLEVKTPAEWTARREEYRRQLQEMLGLWPMPERTDLKPVITGKLEREDFTVEKLQFQALPHLYVTASLYLPKKLDLAVPAILYECGHWRLVTNGVSYGNKAMYQADGAWYARNGYVCLVMDTLLAGEIQGIHTGTRDSGLWWWNARGYTPAGVEAWFGIRALDYLCTRPEVDPNRIGVTGHSGGGAYSWTITALDDRIKAAAPLAGMADLQSHIGDGVLDSHCDCNFFVNYYSWDFPKLAALAAPRPLLVGGTDNDRLFRLSSTVRIYEQLRRLYGMLGVTDRLGLVLAPGPHDETPELQVAVMRWFNRHLKFEDAPIVTAPKKFFTPDELKVFTVLPADAINTNIAATFVPPAGPVALLGSRAGRKAPEQAWLKAVREKCFGGWPAADEPLATERLFAVTNQGVRLAVVDFTSQNLVPLRLYFAQSTGTNAVGPLVLQVLDETDWSAWLAGMRSGFPDALVEEAALFPGATASPKTFADWKQELKATGETRVWFAPRGIGLTAWTTAGKKASQMRRRFMLLGQTLDGMRVWDIRRAVQAAHFVRETGDAKTVLRARGQMGVNALYAALFEPNVVRLELSDLPASHLAGPDYLGVLRVWDLPQALLTAKDRMEVVVQ
jgi:acetyl xylan esterase AXE1